MADKPIKLSNYLRAQLFLKQLKKYYPYMRFQEYRTLRGQAINGDIEGAEKGLHTILERLKVDAENKISVDRRIK